MNRPQWTAELAVTEPAAATLIEGQFSELSPARVELLGAGWDNTAFRVNDAFVFRFPRREIAVPLLIAETALTPALSPRLPLPIPSPRFIGRPAHDYPWPFAGYPLIPGRAASGLSDPQKVNNAALLGRFLAALHAIPLREAMDLGARPDTMGRLEVGRRTARAKEELEQITRLGLIEDPSPFLAILDPAREYAARCDTLTHGDLYPQHLLCDHTGRLSGVIDWGDSHIGDPAIDLAIAHTFLPPRAHGAFAAAYGPIDETTWRMARLRALWHTLIGIVYAHDIGDTTLLRECMISLEYIEQGRNIRSLPQSVAG
ncbi:MAG TPA: phosphotransferase [Armatimonadota bacterium]|nr:phosphotransferase [Armatimonadota bacterium]